MISHSHLFLTHWKFKTGSSLLSTDSGRQAFDLVVPASSAHSFWACGALPPHTRGGKSVTEGLCKALSHYTWKWHTSCACHCTGQGSVVLSYLTARDAGKQSPAECWTPGNTGLGDSQQSLPCGGRSPERLSNFPNDTWSMHSRARTHTPICITPKSMLSFSPTPYKLTAISRVQSFWGL